jgi:hypothetical protein
MGKKVLMLGSGIEDMDHPSFRDPEYRKRHKFITDLALDYKIGQPIPRVKYTDDENGVWKIIFDTLKVKYKETACKEYNNII